MKLKIIIFCGDSWEKWSPKSSSSGIGGSEESVIEIGKELVNLGHEVVVYNRCEEDTGEYDGVIYKDFLDYEGEECDVFISWRNTLGWKMAKNYKVGYHWLHDVTPEEEVMKALALGAKKIMVLSNYHRRLYFRLRNEEVFLTRNGINLDHFKQKANRVPARIFYGSSYDRGLLRILEDWPKIKLNVPEATLHIAYGWQTWEATAKKSGDQTYANFKRVKAKMEDDMKQEGIFHLGRISHMEVAKEMLEADVWGYPTHYPEISCITAMKAQAGGAIPVVIPTAAVAETVQHGYKTDRGYYYNHEAGLAEPQEAREQWLDKVVEVLGQDEEDKKQLRRSMMKHAKTLSWASVAAEWVEEFDKTLGVSNAM